MLTWTVVIALAAGVYLQRAAGALLIDTTKVSPTWRRFLDALPLAIIAAVVALATFTEGGELTANPRLVGVSVAALLAWRRAPMMIVVVAAAAATALTRSLLGG